MCVLKGMHLALPAELVLLLLRRQAHGEEQGQRRRGARACSSSSHAHGTGAQAPCCLVTCQSMHCNVVRR